MILKTTLPALALALVMTLSANYALAQPASKEAPQIDPVLTKMWDDHRQKIAPLKDQLWAKEMEYDALTSNADTKLSEVKPIIAEMSRLKSQIRAEREQIQDELAAKGHGKGFYKGHGQNWNDSYHNGHGKGFYKGHGQNWNDSYHNGRGRCQSRQGYRGQHRY